MDMQEALQPDLYEAMADCDTDDRTPTKRAEKAKLRSLDWLDACLDRHAKSEVRLLPSETYLRTSGGQAGRKEIRLTILQ